MSRNTRSLPGKRALRALAGASLLVPALVLGSGAPVAAPALPPAVTALTQGLAARGGGEMRFLGISVYDGWYWSARPGWTLDAPFALDLHYHRKLAGAKIAERSVDEIGKLGVANAAQLQDWGAAMRRIFPDVAKGDRLTGVFMPPATVRYYANGSLVGEIVDPQFARAFFGIWLDPKTSRADFRQALLGGQ